MRVQRFDLQKMQALTQIPAIGKTAADIIWENHHILPDTLVEVCDTTASSCRKFYSEEQFYSEVIQVCKQR